MSPKEKNRAVLKRLLSSFDALTGCDKEGAAEDAYRHVLTESAGEQPKLFFNLRLCILYQQLTFSAMKRCCR